MSERKQPTPLPANVIAFDFVTRTQVPTGSVPAIEAPDAPAKPKRSRTKKAVLPESSTATTMPDDSQVAAKPKRSRSKKGAAEVPTELEAASQVEPIRAAPKAPRKKREATVATEAAEPVLDNVLQFRPAQKEASAPPPAPFLPLSEADERKRDQFDAWIREGLVMTIVNTTFPDVRVPAQFVGQVMLRLNFSLRYNVPDFRWDDGGIVCTLSFGGTPFRCEVPWGAIYVLSSRELEQAMVEPRSCPPAALPELVKMFPNLVKPRT